MIFPFGKIGEEGRGKRKEKKEKLIIIQLAF